MGKHRIVLIIFAIILALIVGIPLVYMYLPKEKLTCDHCEGSGICGVCDGMGSALVDGEYVRCLCDEGGCTWCDGKGWIYDGPFPSDYEE